MEEIPFNVTAEEIEDKRRRLRAQYGTLYDDISAILFRHDPIGINFETNTDEYEPEVGTILPRLREASCAADLSRIVHEEFLRWFNEDEIVGSPAHYEKIVEEIWNAYQKRSAESQPR
jgi:hypothetical protein